MASAAAAAAAAAASSSIAAAAAPASCVTFCVDDDKLAASKGKAAATSVTLQLKVDSLSLGSPERQFPRIEVTMTGDNGVVRAAVRKRAPPVSWIVVVDTSESVAAFAPLLHACMRTMFYSVARSDDHIALITFSNTVVVLQPLTQRSDITTVKVETLISRITPLGCTNLVDAVQRAHAVAATAPSPPRIILISDGVHNATTGDPLGLIEACTATLGRVPLYQLLIGRVNAAFFVALQRRCPGNGVDVYDPEHMNAKLCTLLEHTTHVLAGELHVNGAAIPFGDVVTVSDTTIMLPSQARADDVVVTGTLYGDATRPFRLVVRGGSSSGGGGDGDGINFYAALQMLRERQRESEALVERLEEFTDAQQAQLLQAGVMAMAPPPPRTLVGLSIGRSSSVDRSYGVAPPPAVPVLSRHNAMEVV